MQIVIKNCETEEELQGILALQKANHSVNLTKDEIDSQGFVTVQHSFEQLKKMNGFAPHIIAKDGEKVVAYTLAMTKESRNDIPILIPMFEIFDELIYKKQPVSDYHYIVVGQACVDKNYRGKGILDRCYEFYSQNFKSEFDFAITEIASNNQRSIKAHERIGFQLVHQYQSPDNIMWNIVIWNWNSL